MRSRPKLFAKLAFLITVPLLLITVLSFLISLEFQKKTIHSQLEQEFLRTKESFADSLRARDRELSGLKSSSPILAYIQAADKQGHTSSASGHSIEESLQLKQFLSDLFASQRSYLSIAGFGADKEIIFIANSSQGADPMVFRDKEFIQSDSPPNERVWTANQNEILCYLNSDNVLGTTRRCSILLDDHEGALVSQVSVDVILTEVARLGESFIGSDKREANSITVLDKDGTIVYHTNDALKHQRMSRAYPDFTSVAMPMIDGRSGTQLYRSTTGDEWLAVYGPMATDTGSNLPNLSLAVSRDVTILTGDLKRFGFITAFVAVLLGLGSSTFLTWFYERQTRRLERVTESVTAIAKGKLDLRVDARSSDDIRPLADGVNLMTEQLRQQLAREAETRQVQSFVRLSAMLTHDLKNAIGSLSLLVTNMEQHFDNAEFRADAMKSLTGATQKLRTLVEKLDNPVNTLSGEFKMPAPVDVVPLLQRVVADTAEPRLGNNRLQLNLPESLMAQIDGERIEKVIENLVLNALEAMTERPGTLSISAGPEDSNFIYVEVSDTGVGLSDRFIEERLFHAFATTKKRGMGLGLYTCREVVKANGGRIEVSSREGAGTTFRLVLPSPPSD